MLGRTSFEFMLAQTLFSLMLGNGAQAAEHGSWIAGLGAQAGGAVSSIAGLEVGVGGVATGAGLYLGSCDLLVLGRGEVPSSPPPPWRWEGHAAAPPIRAPPPLSPQHGR